jgi:hypothetical protein
MILDGERLSQETYGEALDPREYLLRLYPDVAARVPPLDRVVLTAEPLVARVNHGVWIASCPCGARGTPAPGGVVFTATPLVCCARCGNQAAGRGWRTVALPDTPTRYRIEAILLCRPNAGDRNWEPGETLADLLAQNRDHGDPVPDWDEPEDGAGVPVLPGPRWPSRGVMTAVLAATSPRRGFRRLLGRR